jgi:hypothetical protein
VLNTMQQVGGALGLSLLGTVATQTMTDRVSDLGRAAASVGGTPLTGTALEQAQALVGQQVFTEGATDAFLLAAGLMIISSLVTWIFLNVKHQELATDGPEGAPVHVG